MELILKDLTLKNFTCHRDLSLSFEEGMTAIVGDNGSGKSTVIQAFEFLFNGRTKESKEETISTGEATGHVSGHFEADGKEGYIERHLDSSKVILKYDGQECKKSGDVKKLWDELLGITPDIFSNVIIAKQKEIPLLYNGDPSVREKLFQKIFSVPDTNKLRTTIWDKYIKVAPPIYDVVSDEVLNDQLVVEETSLAESNKKLKGIELVPKDKLDEINERVRFVKGCIEDEKTVVRLNREILEKSKKIVTIEQELSGKSVMSAPEVQVLGKEIDRLKKTRSEVVLRVKLEQSVKLLDREYVELIEVREKIDKKIGSIDIAHYEEEREELLKNRSMMELKTRLETEMKDYVDIVSDEDFESLKKKFKGEKELLRNAFAKDTEVTNKLKRLNDEISEIRSLKSKPVCPTCHQELKDLKAFIEHTEKEIEALEVEGKGTTKIYEELLVRCTEFEKTVERHASRISEKRNIVDQLSKLGDVKYSDEDMNLVDGIMSRFRKLEDEQSRVASEIRSKSSRLVEIKGELCEVQSTGNIEDIDKEIEEKEVVFYEQATLSDTSKSLRDLEGEVKVSRAELRNCRQYDGKEDPNLEVNGLETVVRENAESVEEANNLKIECRVTEKNIQNINGEKVKNKDLYGKNKRRNLYVEKLNTMYEALHTNNFPRSLIQSYSDIVDDVLQLVIVKFSFPYSVKINSRFDIEVFDENYNLIPYVSGGEEIVLGLCLRYALHILFGQGFPIIAIDEGSQNLDGYRREMYFESLKYFKQESHLRQIFVIDHHPEIRQVADHVIELTKT